MLTYQVVKNEKSRTKETIMGNWMPMKINIEVYYEQLKACKIYEDFVRKKYTKQKCRKT